MKEKGKVYKKQAVDKKPVEDKVEVKIQKMILSIISIAQDNHICPRKLAKLIINELEEEKGVYEAAQQIIEGDL